MVSRWNRSQIKIAWAGARRNSSRSTPYVEMRGRCRRGEGWSRRWRRRFGSRGRRARPGCASSPSEVFGAWRRTRARRPARTAVARVDGRGDPATGDESAVPAQDRGWCAEQSKASRGCVAQPSSAAWTSACRSSTVLRADHAPLEPANEAPGHSCLLSFGRPHSRAGRRRSLMWVRR